MPLKLSLKPEECIEIGGVLIKCVDRRATLLIVTPNAPIGRRFKQTEKPS